ncbi:MAG: helix-turn-helix transcriptional regulator [Clostridia bacterium]|nr:helix-turn-helix transcriptional regulator [Clostridia bacterium]
MLIFDFHTIGNKLYAIRKQTGMTQAEVAEAAGVSDRTYADIERGSVNMRIETILRICNTLHVTPDEILTEDNPSLTARQEELWERLNACPPKERETALGLLEVYLKSVPSCEV